MPKYLFTSDQRISELPSRIQKTAEVISSGRGLISITDKSDNNNATTLKFYYNLQEGTEICSIASKDPTIAIRNFVTKFQFPNVRTPESFNDSLNEHTLFAPFRAVVRVLFLMAQESTNYQSRISYDEILYYLFCDKNVCCNPRVDFDQVAKIILKNRSLHFDLESRIASILEWNQYKRQIGELMNVLPYASKAFKITNRVIYFSMNSREYKDDLEFINSILDFKYIWFPSNRHNFDLSTKEYISFMDTKSTPFNVIDVSTTPDKKKVEEVTKEETGLNVIFYGCPGTGKSFKVKKITEGLDGSKAVYFSNNGQRIEMPSEESDRIKTPSNVFRTTFHPDYDYATFVGTYKPSMRPKKDGNGNDLGEDELKYTFVPQVFTKAYVRAWKSWNDQTLVGKDKNVYLIIEEINRGNCAQIFGDLFQLLDRKDGFSEFPIIPDSELRRYLKGQNVPFESLRFPPNLYLYATMNTSDQSLFPMDSAFKRRWSMEYIPIKYEGNEAESYTLNLFGNVTKWTQFLRLVNAKIREATNSEDKQMGEFFIKSKEIKEKEFINKVMFYLWNDVCKDLYSATRPSKSYFLRDSKDSLFTFAELFSGRQRKGEPETSPEQLIRGFIAYLKAEYSDNDGSGLNEQGQDPMKEAQA